MNEADHTIHGTPQTATAGRDSDPLRALAQAGDWRALLQLGRFELADQTLRFHPDPALDPEAALAIGALTPVERAVRLKRTPDALALFDRIEPKPDVVMDWGAAREDLAALAEASEHVEKREPQAAREALSKLQTGLFEAEAKTLEGPLRIVDGEVEASWALFDEAISLDPKHVRALTNRGNLRLEAGDVDGAISDYEAALAVEDGFANAHHNLGVAYRRKGNIGKSVAALRRAQRASLRSDQDTLRARTRRGSGGSEAAPRVRSYRWLYYVAIGALVWWIVTQQGLI
jgi:tetratricopeptide (TPR) repeat protein